MNITKFIIISSFVILGFVILYLNFQISDAQKQIKALEQQIKILKQEPELLAAISYKALKVIMTYDSIMGILSAFSTPYFSPLFFQAGKETARQHKKIKELFPEIEKYSSTSIDDLILRLEELQR